MNIKQKKMLYESIIKQVSKTVKKAINESIIEDGEYEDFSAPHKAIIKLFNALGIDSIGADYELVDDITGREVGIDEVTLVDGKYLEISASHQTDDETDFDEENLWRIFYIIRNNAVYFVNNMTEDEIYNIADKIESEF